MTVTFEVPEIASVQNGVSEPVSVSDGTATLGRNEP